MTIVYRPAHAQDLELADALVVSSINDLTIRHGFGPMAAASPTRFQTSSLKDDPDGLWVAEEDGALLGFAWSWVCGDLWFLAQLFVSPDQQGRNIGNELIQLTLEHARKAGVANKALITFSFNTVSQGLYLRHAMYPRFPIYSVRVAREHLVGRLPPPQVGFTPLELDPSTLRRLAQADEGLLGVSREKHHRFLIGDGGTKGFNLYDGNEWTGYAYIDGSGHIGPLAILRPDAIANAFETALHLAVQNGAPQVSAFLPGAAETALDVAMAHGMRIKFPMLLMSAKEFGDWSRYFPRNPGFM